MPRYLPEGIDEFDELRAHPDALYVDKTAQIAALATEMLGLAPQLFLARPRRFGKTLLVSTLEALFQGRRELFEGTWIGQDGRWDWARHRYPVLRLDMSVRGAHSRARFEDQLASRLRRWIRRLDVDADVSQVPPDVLADVIDALQAQHGRPPVVLIDEYDTPLTENLDHPEALEEVQSSVRAFYGALKSCRRHIRCVFMTGITRIAQAGLFSGANHFKDVSFRPKFSALLGFTQAELRETPDLDADLARCAANVGYGRADFQRALQAYYDGYRFSHKDQAVYNPYSLSLCLSTLREEFQPAGWEPDAFPNGWSESGTPSLVFRLGQKGRFSAEALPEGADGNDPLRILQKAHFDAAYPERDVLMYQAGYLTLKPRPQGGRYLDFPNREVRFAFETELRKWQRHAVQTWHDEEAAAGGAGAYAMREALLTGEPQQAQARIDDFLQRFSYMARALPPQTRSVQQYEIYYRDMLYSALLAIAAPVRLEERTARGRIDIALLDAARTVLLECKADGSAAQALRQAWDKGYADPYRASGKPVRVCGLHFDTERRTIAEIEIWDLGTYDPDSQRWEHEPVDGYALTRISRMTDAQRHQVLNAAGDAATPSSSGASLS